MADHYYSITAQLAGVRKASAVVVDTSSTAGTKIELRLTDGGTKRIHVADALQWLADCIRNKNPGVIASGQFTD